MSSKLERTGPRILTIGEEADQQRIDNFLIKTFKGVPKSRIYKMLRKGEVRVNKGRIKPVYRLQIGDQVRLPPAHVLVAEQASGLTDKQKSDIEETILYEDKGLIVINKPSGLAVHGGSGISQGVIERLRMARPEQKGLELVHRLDRDTSGLLLIAKRRSALRQLHQLQRENRVDKRYLALLSGHWKRGKISCAEPLKKSHVGGERIVRVDPTGKAALTRFRVQRSCSDFMLVEAKLETGRTHQIRVHAQSLGTPIVGDTKYGDETVNQQCREQGIRRLFLHAWRLTFPWGENGAESGRKMTFEAPLEENLVNAFEMMCSNEEK
ncbi:hypothetical protein BOW39_11530 [Solemya velum gill symbiont]|uniref:RluA family pseudouridine synthase n=1 Tax=Solemya velum gill symbiont TaxID=2340 RepID=UPI0009975E1E|nr:RluA family pseudouridine synthase [Solemya velum gill symbiont]OOZ48298.1 hypothetical protein BOW39_11530 [Solemya velum gill symbiont]